MPLTLVTIPCLSDNYAYLLHNAETKQTALVDAPETQAIAAELARRGWELTDILLTHHHWDHIDGLEGLRGPNVRVIGAAADAHRLPPLDQMVQGGDRIEVCGEPVEVIEVYGHTIGHVAFHFPQTAAVFTADSLMALGCGRLFEGTPAQMWDALLRLRDLPPDTLICSGHEYTAGNARFAATIDPANPDLAARIADTFAKTSAGIPTVPSLLSLERATNPFLRADDPDLQAAIGMTRAAAIDVFAEIRARKDKF